MLLCLSSSPMICGLQLYLALSAVLASGGAQPMTALHEADAELASLVPEAGKSKVAASNPHLLNGSYSMSQ